MFTPKRFCSTSVNNKVFFLRKPKVVDLPDELDVQEDDVVSDSPIPQHALFSAPQGQSQPVAKVFVERNRE